MKLTINFITLRIVLTSNLFLSFLKSFQIFKYSEQLTKNYAKCTIFALCSLTKFEKKFKFGKGRAEIYEFEKFTARIRVFTRKFYKAIPLLWNRRCIVVPT